MSDKKKRSVWSVTLAVLAGLLVLAVIFVPIIDKNFKSTLKPELKEFAIENPEEVTEIFLASKANTKSYVKLTKEANGKWMVNGEYPAEEEKINMLLYDYLAKLKAKNPLPKTAVDNVIKSMAANAIKVEVYKGTRKDKVFYVGGNAADEMGTHMLLENSSMPFVVHIPGFMGYPSAVFNLNPKRWKSVNLFLTSIVELKTVSLFYPADAGGSFTITKEERSLTITPFVQEDMRNPAQLDIPLLKQYTATFENLTYESIYEGLAAKLADSVVRASQPYAVVELVRVDGKKHVLKIYKKPVTAESPQHDNYGNPVDYDLDRFYGVLDGNTDEILSVQSFVFKNILKRYGDFFTGVEG
jgi:hypothetical protein